MPTLENSVLVDAPQEKLFWLSQDYERRLEWDRYLRVARLEAGATRAAKGVEAYCESRKGIGMTVKYISFHPPRQVAMEMTKGPWVFQKFSGSWRFKEEIDGRIRVFFRYNFKTRFGWLGKLLLNPIISRILETDIKNRLGYFKQAAEASALSQVPVSDKAH
ncbi:type II toxin-antitoxin system RatA family toxin [Rufibacter roseus]|uniref:Type II toxin-antitoxin system RatA family toxin n=1 Tax=Rufibacter roseus TaxID=1567108 RepID=A0ABW2DSB3_9BACT|nr:SRPBCC family protein [Rufibacter roseus]